MYYSLSYADKAEETELNLKVINKNSQSSKNSFLPSAKLEAKTSHLHDQ